MSTGLAAGERGDAIVQNALGEAQTLVLLGGSSDIGRAIVARLITPSTRTIVLAGPRPATIATGDLPSARD